MSRHLLLPLVFLVTLFPLVLRAEEAKVTLQLPADFMAKTCSVPAWKDLTILWRGVKDVRTEPEIGRQTKKKGKDPISILSEPPLDVVLDRILRDLFSACGIRILKEGESERELSAEIVQFYAGVEKRLFTGKSEAKSSLRFILNRGGSLTKTFDVGYELESSRTRQKDIKQLEQTLNELLARTLEQIPKSAYLREM